MHPAVFLALLALTCWLGDAANSTGLHQQPSFAHAPPSPWKDIYLLKGLQPDFWPQKDDVSGNMGGAVSMNLVWAEWQATLHTPPCSAGQFAFDNQCFTVNQGVESAIQEWSRRGLKVVGVVYGVPAWARIACQPVGPGMEIFCAPKNATDFGRFAGAVAARFNGGTLGLVSSFVIHNEVNTNDWFNVGCGRGVPCDVAHWQRTYAANYIAAYDLIKRANPNARVLFSLEHHFGRQFDQPRAQNPMLSCETLIEGVVPLLGNRAWSVAFHPYPPDLLSSTFSADDWPHVTYGNIGAVVGWLYSRYPSTPSALQVELTESGINSISPRSSDEAQNNAACQAYRNIVGTPGITTYIYHRMIDHPVEVKDGLGLGLWHDAAHPKPAWSTWALCNRYDLSPPKLSCGFEHVPFTLLQRGYHATRGHWATSRMLPSGFKLENQWRLYRIPPAGVESQLLFECQVGGHNLLTSSSACEHQLPLGPVGYIARSQVSGTVPLHRCTIHGGNDHFVSADPHCEGATFEQLLGYAWTA